MSRSRFPVLERVAYLNAGSVGPLARDTVEAMRAEEDRALLAGRGSKAFFERVRELRGHVRELVAGLVAVEPAQVALTSSTSDGCQVVIAGLELREGDEIVTTADEHFGLLGPLGASPARVRVAATEGRGGEAALEAILAEVGPHTRLVAVSHVLWTTGNRLPLGELRAAIDVPLLIDGAQSVGAIAVEAGGVDFMTVSGQKWLCGPEGTGALVVRDPEALPVGRPGYLGQKEHEPDGSFVPQDGAARFDTAFMPSPALVGLAHVLETLPADAFERVEAAAARACELLAPRVELLTDPGQSGLLAWRDPDAQATAARLAEAGVVVRDVPGRSSLRASCGWWTDEHDLARLVKSL